ncbi:MAG: polysaccharide biosynthesis protein [Paludibacteraceae bacterium]|nr:polysaccharide biosynthesis protein [Paludibacteraceae bacterium]
MKKRFSELKRSDVFTHVTNLTYLPKWGVLLIDLLLALIAYVISYMISYNLAGLQVRPGILPIWQQAGIVMVLQAIMFWVFHTYSGILRFSTFVDATKVVLSVLAAGITPALINSIIRYTTGQYLMLNSILYTYIFVAIVLLVCWRVTIKLSFEYMSHHSPGIRPVMIYGTKSAGLAIAKMLNSSMDSQYRPVGFITDADDNVKHELLGLKVYVKNEHLIRILKAKEVQDIIVSPLKMKHINPAKDLTIFLDNGIRILTTPYFSDFHEEESDEMTKKIGSIEAIKVEDLLERPEIHINTDNVSQVISDKVVMVTGAAGSIGSEIVRQVSKFEPRLVVLAEIAESPLHDLSLDLNKLFPKIHFARVITDVRNRDMLREVFEEYHPQVIFHAAAYKHVPLMEEYPTQAILANVLGTKNVADLAVEYKAERFVMVSTDKAVNPTNVMGASKRIAEIYVQSLFRKLSAQDPNVTKFITTRFGNVLGSNGSVVPFFKKQIAAGGPVTVTHPDIIRYFMTIPEASCLVLEASTLGKGGEIFCFDMGAPVKISDLAKNMIRLAGYQPGKDIEIVYTGLRPGEKLYEELLNQKELTMPTANEKIMVANVRENDYDTMSKLIDELIRSAQKGLTFPSVKMMKQIVPEFQSRNSIYEQLDK